MGMIFSSILMISVKDGVKVVCVFVYSFPSDFCLSSVSPLAFGLLRL